MTKPSPALFPLPQQMTTAAGRPRCYADCAQKLAEHVGCPPAGVLHQHQPRNAVLLRGAMIDLA